MLRPDRCIHQMSYFGYTGETFVFALHSDPHPGALNHLADDSPRYATLL
jgi:hypothetical protein